MIARLAVASVWLVHGLYNKLLGGSARHLAIVQSVPGLEGAAGEAMLVAGRVRRSRARGVDRVGESPARLRDRSNRSALLSMNVVELAFARHLLLWPAGLVPVNLLFLALAWIAAIAPREASLRTRLRRHPIADSRRASKTA